MIYLISNSKPANLPSEVHHLAVCEIKFREFSLNLGEFDALLITSKNAVKSLEFNQISPCEIPVFALSSKTYEACRNFGFSSVFNCANSTGNEFAHNLKSKLAGKKALYLRAEKIASNLPEILNSCDLTQIVAYENLTLKLPQESKPEANSVLIFTSPKNVESFIANFGWDKSYKAVAIGKTTAKSLSEICECEICENQSINSAINLALSII